jgi:hypothetical protein
MSNKHMQLNARGLIAAAIASAASGQVLAEEAGRVSFVSGDVTVSSGDGQTRALKRGDIINGGDKIETRSGRLQLRFTDGGFVSLQPNTVFGVDQYLYANKPPEETSLFFSLLRGGMRTITGAIGKVNKQSYKVRTPVATIGIRGTEYLARVNPNKVVVSVGSGLVSVSNDYGNITGGAGQNIEALGGSAPHLTNEQPDINATGPEGDQELYAADDESQDATQRLGDQLREDGNNYVLINGAPPVYTYVPVPTTNALPNGGGYSLQLTDSSGNTQNISGLSATFDPATGAITSLTQGGTTSTLPPGNVAGAAAAIGGTFKPGTLKFVNVAQYGSVGWGEITDGVAETSTIAGLPSSVANGTFQGYLIGQGAADPGFTGGKASYSLRGGSLARVNQGSSTGTLDHLNLDVNLLLGTFNVDMLLKMNDTNIGDVAVTGNNVFAQRGSTNFFLSSGLSTTSTGSFCSNGSGCNSSISGFFAANGSQVGTAYSVNTNTGSSHITGYAALGLDTLLPEQTGYTIGVAGNSNGPFTAATVILRGDGALTSFYVPDVCGDGCQSYFDSGTLKFANLGHSGDLYWGDYTDGDGVFSTGNNAFSPSQGLGQFQSFIVGKAATAITVGGTATYSLLGGTPVHTTSGASASLDHLNLTLKLDLGLIDLDMAVLLSGEGVETISVTGKNILKPLQLPDGSYAGGFQLAGKELTTSSNGSFCSSGCSTELGAFFTNNGTKLGVDYQISGAFDSLSGVAALGTSGTGNTDPHRALASGDNFAFVGLLGSNSATSGAIPYVEGGIVNSDSYDFSANTFDSSGKLTDASHSSIASPGTLLDTGTAQYVAADTGTYKTLHWGVVTGGDVTFNNQATTLNANDKLHYITGVMTGPGTWADLNNTYSGYSATYSVVGSTHPTDLAGNTGTLTSASLKLYLGSAPTLDVALGVDMGNSKTFAVNSTGNVLTTNSAAFGFKNLATTGSGCVSSCATDVAGFFAGPQANQAGLGYTIKTLGTTVNGAVALERGALAAPPANGP